MMTGFWKKLEKFEFDGEEPENPLFLAEQLKAKRIVSRVATQRIESYQRALSILPFVEEARIELTYEYEEKGYNKSVGDNAVAKWLNSKIGKIENPNLLPARGKLWSSTQLRLNIMDAPARIIEAAVLECRTRMTVLALSADFAKPIDAVTKLEQEYLGYIADAIEIGHRLNGNEPKSREKLLEEARYKAIDVAAMQRQRKPMSMMARERLWKNFPPIVKKVFES